MTQFVPAIHSFVGWPKIARLNRDCIVTEKIDGTNAAIQFITDPDGTVAFCAQSRTRVITPEADNFGFARWVHDNVETLHADLGDGLHAGEWWGQGIQRRYGLDHKRFSLFNAHRWMPARDHFATFGLDVVPVLYQGPFDTRKINSVVSDLEDSGSIAASYFMNPEGIIVWHAAASTMFKVTIARDQEPKGQS